MGSRSILVYHSPCLHPVPALVQSFAAEGGLEVSSMDAAGVLQVVNRGYPAVIVLAGGATGEALALCRTLKSEPFSGIIPVVLLAEDASGEVTFAALQAGFDEVLTPAMGEREQRLRLGAAIRRAERDVSVHPTTRLPGTAQIARDIADRLSGGERFAVCYADLDHFKEFNDRYGYNEGDRVILLLSKILRDVVKAYAPAGFVGHIGGDDFIFNVPLEVMRQCCEEVIALFDELIPYQYTEEDRRAGYFLGRDRRGNILWVPIMTISIGVVTNQNRTFTHPARVSELATEMKNFAKKLPGSVYAIDRRSDAQESYAPSASSTPDTPQAIHRIEP